MNNNGVCIILVVSIANIETFVITVVENYVDQHLFLHQLDVCLFRIALSIKLSFIHGDWIILFTFHGFWRCHCIEIQASVDWMKAYGMDVYPRWIFFFLFHLCHCENMRELLRKRRSALNNPQYQIIPRVQRMNYWPDDSYEDFNSYEDALEKSWLDGDFGMRSTAYKQKIFSPHKQNRRQRNIKVMTTSHYSNDML